MADNTKEKIDITFFTDPLCCWSWAFEAQLQHLKVSLGTTAAWHFKMGGLLPSWTNFHDHANAVSRPAQMGPVWMHAGQIAGNPIHHQLWMKDPPASSYPSCIAVKCASLQSPAAGESMLYLLREACMGEGKNIAKQEILFEAAANYALTDKAFSFENWKIDFLYGSGMEAFRTDLHLVNRYRINRFPSLVVKFPDAKTIVIAGYRHHDQVMEAIESHLQTNPSV